ncbi:transcription factor, contains a PHD finger motif [Coemansia sp. RSA 1199]|nr:transcription factor, contains a PHD finger motif [Coemansia sp. RSA 1199]
MQSSEALQSAGVVPHAQSSETLQSAGGMSQAQLGETLSPQVHSGPLNSDAEAIAPAEATPKQADANDSGTMHVDNSSENGEDVVMKDKLLPKMKQVSKCSYCENNSGESLKTVPCLECGSRCHIDCINCTAKFKHKILLGDDFFHFKCHKCTDGNERFRRYHLSWVDVVHITLFNLTHNPAVRPSGADPSNQFGGEHGPQEYGDSRVYFHYKADVARFIDQHWAYFWTKARGETWINSASSALSTNSTENVPEDGRFESGKAKYNKNGMWALTDDLRFPSSYDSLQQQKTRTIMYTFAEDGSLIELRTQATNGRRKRRTDTAPKAAGSRAKKPRAGAHSGNDYASPGAGSKRGARARRAWSIGMWPDIDNPQGPAHMSREETHAAAQYVIESDRLTVWNDKGYRMAKASHGVETGAWYFEAQILPGVRPEANLRIGWSQISGELQAPCGYDVFSYSMRASPCTRFHAAIGSHYGAEFGPGDTLGVLLYLPELDADERQDLADRKWRPGERYRQFTYSRPESQRPLHADDELPPLPVLAGSELVYFKNGKCLGPAFQKLYLGKYYPAVSSYMGGKVKVNLGPDFKFPPPAVWHKDTKIQAISELEFTLPEPAKAAGEEQPAEVAGEVKPAEAVESANGVIPAETEAVDSGKPTEAVEMVGEDKPAELTEPKPDISEPAPVGSAEPKPELTTTQALDSAPTTDAIAEPTPEVAAESIEPKPVTDTDATPDVTQDESSVVMDTTQDQPSAESAVPADLGKQPSDSGEAKSSPPSAELKSKLVIDVHPTESSTDQTPTDPNNQTPNAI